MYIQYIIMSFVSDYKFNNIGRIGYDLTDKTQENIQNSRYSTYNTTAFFGDKITGTQIDFMSTQPTLNAHATGLGAGIGGSKIDDDSRLLIQSAQERSLEKLQLFQRPFATVPYLGRGSCDPVLESQLIQGETSADKKSVSTIMDKSFLGYTMQPSDAEMEERVKNTKHTVEESALNGWIRGGAPTRDINDPISSGKH
jgi:hypothetical protein